MPIGGGDLDEFDIRCLIRSAAEGVTMMGSFFVLSWRRRGAFDDKERKGARTREAREGEQRKAWNIRQDPN